MLAGTAGVVVVATSVSIRLRREIRRDPWTVHIAYLVAGGLVLPVELLAVLLAGPVVHRRLEGRTAPRQWLLVTSATCLAIFAGRWVVGWQSPEWNLLRAIAAGTVLLVVRAALVAIGLRLQEPGALWADVLGESADALLGIVAVCFGGVLGVALLREPTVAPLAAPLLWALLIGVGMSAFPLALVIISVRASNAADTRQLSAMSQSIGYLIASAGPFLFGVLHDSTGDWSASLVAAMVIVVVQSVVGFFAGRPRTI